nr:protein HESO1 isoform X1 [Tanacetum cinerariifolium]
MRPFGCPVTILNTLDSLGKFNGKNTDGNVAFEVKEPEFKGRKPESEVHVSPSSSAQTKKHDDKTKREAKGKSPVKSLTGYRNLSTEFEDFSDKRINEVNVVDTSVLAVGKIFTNSTNTFSAAELVDITYSDDEEDVGAEADFTNLETTITVSLIPTTRVHKDHPMTQIIGDLSSTAQTRSMTRVAKDQGGLSQINNDDFHTCMFASFLSQEEPKRIYVDDIIFGSTNKDLCKAFEKLTKDKFQISSMGELTLFLDGKLASTPIDTEKPLLKDPDGEDVDVHTYRSMIGSLMYLTSSRLNIMFACMSAKKTTWNEFSSSMASAIICLSTGKRCSGVETSLFEGMMVAQQVSKCATEVNVYDVPTAGVTSKDDANVLSMQDDESKPAELKEVVEAVTTVKLMTEVVTAAATITAVVIVAAPTLTTAPSGARKRKRVVIRDLEETATPSTIIYAEPKSKDKGKGIIEDLEVLWKLVKERFAFTKPKNLLDDFLLTTLGAIFEKSDVQDQIWRNQRSVHGLTKRKYLLTRFTLDQMLNNVRLEVEEESEVSLELLRDILQVVNPTHEDWPKRFQIINDLGAIVGTLKVLRGATVEPFGSFVSNLFTRWGDLDISIELANGACISSVGKKVKENLLLDVLKALKGRGGFHGVKSISHARVPILKCESNKDNISCDISINNLIGQMKSKLLFCINDIDGRFRDMVLIAKEWAKAHGLKAKIGVLTQRINAMSNGMSEKGYRSKQSELKRSKELFQSQQLVCFDLLRVVHGLQDKAFKELPAAVPPSISARVESLDGNTNPSSAKFCFKLHIPWLNVPLNFVLETGMRVVSSSLVNCFHSINVIIERGSYTALRTNGFLKQTSIDMGDIIPQPLCDVTKERFQHLLCHADVAKVKYEADGQSVIKCTNAKAIWTGLILAHEGPSETNETKITALRLKFNAFKALEGEKVLGTFTRLKCLLNDLENNGFSISQAEVNATFVNSLPRKWLSMNQTQRANNAFKNGTLAALYGNFLVTKQTIDKVVPIIVTQKTKTKSSIDSSTEKLVFTLMQEVKDLKEQIKTHLETSPPTSQSGSSKSAKSKMKAFMAITEEELSVGKTDARSEYTHIDLHYVEDKRKNLLFKFYSLKLEVALYNSELGNLKNTKALNLSYQNEITKLSLDNESLKALRGRGKIKERVSSKEINFKKSDVSSSETIPEIPSNSESE